MQLLNPRWDSWLTVPSGLSLSGQKLGRKRRAEPFRLCPVFGAHVGAQVAPQRCPILRMSARIVHQFSTLNHSKRRPTDISNPVQRTFWNPDSRTFYFLVDSEASYYPQGYRPSPMWSTYGNAILADGLPFTSVNGHQIFLPLVIKNSP